MSEWWETFFRGLWVDVQLGWAALMEDEEVDDLERRLRLDPESAVLDVPCGEGRIGRALAKRGHRVTGVDITERFLKEGAGAPRRTASRCGSCTATCAS